jgi:prephenate dehydrogenase
VAKLNEDMWTELFMMNQPALQFELERIIDSLQQYRDALESKDAEKMHELLKEGRIMKEWSLAHSITE